MPSPFPGMDPWLEDPEIWRGVHARLITRSADFLQPQLHALGYFVDIEERIFVEESERHVYPDLAVIERPTARRPGTSTVVLEADEPVRVRTHTEPEVRERFLQIFDARGRQLVTQIEFISHSNKNFSRGRELYGRKRDELREAGVNLVEIDLLRSGTPIVDLSETALALLKPWDYIVNIVRHGQNDHEVYPIALRDHLPRIRVPLRPPSPDAVLDVQTVFQQLYEAGPYGDRINYAAPPTPPLSRDDDAWASALLAKAGPTAV